jgi:hypothetical protein
LLDEVKGADLALCFTKIPYDNNYFFEARGNLVIVSFYAWEQLTILPMENRAAYFVASLVRFRLPLPSAHDDTTGCINDFLWDKSGIDVGMRSGLLCLTCRQYLDQHKVPPHGREILDGINNILGDLGAASRKEDNVIEYWKQSQAFRNTDITDKFAVFLCHNAKDKVGVRKIAQALESQGLRTWLDEEQLRPGLAWQVVLEEQIGSIESVAVFVGNSGLGPWQDMEIRAFLSEFVRRRCPVIPVILPDAETIPELPIFLRQLTWVDFRQTPTEAIDRLIWGITGKKPRRTAT